MKPERVDLPGDLVGSASEALLDLLGSSLGGVGSHALLGL